MKKIWQMQNVIYSISFLLSMISVSYRSMISEIVNDSEYRSLIRNYPESRSSRAIESFDNSVF